MNRITAIRVAAEISRFTGLDCRARKDDNTLELRTPRGQLIGTVDENVPLDLTSLSHSISVHVAAVLATL